MPDPSPHLEHGQLSNIIKGLKNARRGTSGREDEGGDEVVMGGWVFGPAGLILWSGSTPMRKRRMGPWPTLGR